MYYSIGKQKVFARKHQEKNGKLKIACKNRKYLEEEKSDNGLKVKNDNGPVSVFICYFSPSKGIRDISYYFLFDMPIGSTKKAKGLSDTRFESISSISPICCKCSIKLAKNVNSAEG